MHGVCRWGLTFFFGIPTSCETLIVMFSFGKVVPSRQATRVVEASSGFKCIVMLVSGFRTPGLILQN
jgi:hypothetical protein